MGGHQPMQAQAQSAEPQSVGSSGPKNSNYRLNNTKKRTRMEDNLCLGRKEEKEQGVSQLPLPYRSAGNVKTF